MNQQASPILVTCEKIPDVPEDSEKEKRNDVSKDDDEELDSDRDDVETDVETDRETNDSDDEDEKIKLLTDKLNILQKEVCSIKNAISKQEVDKDLLRD